MPYVQEPANPEFSIKAMHLFATIGALTARGGRVTDATSSVKIAGLTIARVGDVVTYEDGSEAVIADGAGFAAVSGDKPLALVGSHLSNGDTIVETLQSGRGIIERDSDPIPGLFDPAYVPPSAAPGYRFAVRGATTRDGGVLRKASSDFTVSVAHGNAARMGDVIEYANGSTATIVSGVGLSDQQAFAPLAIVGSEMDNGDVITDSPDRKEHRGVFVPVRRPTVTR